VLRRDYCSGGNAALGRRCSKPRGVQQVCNDRGAAADVP